MLLVVRLEEEARLEGAARFPPVLFFFAVAMVSDPFRVGFPALSGRVCCEMYRYMITVLTMPAIRLPRPTTQQ